MKAKSSPKWPWSIANWIAFKNKEPRIGIQEFPLFTDAWITAQIQCGPYAFINTVAVPSSGVRPAVVLRYSIHRGWEPPDFSKTNSILYHAGSPQQELAALASLIMGVRFRAGNSMRSFQPNGDPLGTPIELLKPTVPQVLASDGYKLPSAAKGQHALTDLEALNHLLKLSPKNAGAIVRAARLYQDAMWLAESEPELSWLLLVSAVETAAGEWHKKRRDKIARLRDWKPQFYDYLVSLKDRSILESVADHLKDSVGITAKFVAFVMEFIPEAPPVRPPEWAQFNWQSANLQDAIRRIYGYRCEALHEGRPFPSPMCQAASTLDASWSAPAETMIGFGASERGGVWLKEKIPMNLYLFEYIARNVLLSWWIDRRKG